VPGAHWASGARTKDEIDAERNTAGKESNKALNKESL